MKDNNKNLVENIASGVVNFYSSTHKNLKESVSEVTVSDFFVKSPKGVALEVGFKTLKGIGADILKDAFSKETDEKYLNNLIEKHEKSQNKSSEQSEKSNNVESKKIQRNKNR